MNDTWYEIAICSINERYVDIEAIAQKIDLVH